MRFEIQFAVAAIPPQTPLNLKGQISELTIHGTVPIPGEKNMMQSVRPISATHPYLLGHPLVYHSLWLLRTVLFEIKHDPGSSCNKTSSQITLAGFLRRRVFELVETKVFLFVSMSQTLVVSHSSVAGRIPCFKSVASFYQRAQRFNIKEVQIVERFVSF